MLLDAPILPCLSTWGICTGVGEGREGLDAWAGLGYLLGVGEVFCCISTAARIPEFGTILQYSSSSASASRECKGCGGVTLLGVGLNVGDLTATGWSLSIEQYWLSWFSVLGLRFV